METLKKLIKEMTSEQIGELIQFNSYQAARNKDVLFILHQERNLRNEDVTKNINVAV